MAYLKRWGAVILSIAVVLAVGSCAERAKTSEPAQAAEAAKAALAAREDLADRFLHHAAQLTLVHHASEVEQGPAINSAGATSGGHWG